MIQSMLRVAIVETLLNTLEAERYVRGPLLLTIVDELAATVGFEVAANEASAFLESLMSGQLREADFVDRVRALRELVRGLGATASAA